MYKYSICLILLIICGFSLSVVASDPPPAQVLVETRIVEANQDFVREIGFEWGVGPTFSHLTNGNDPVNVTGVTFLGGVDILFNPILGVFAHAKFSQFGEKYKYEGGFNQFRVSGFGIDGGVKIHFVPDIKVTPFVIVGADVAVNAFGAQKWKQNDEKVRDIFKLNEQESRVLAGIKVGAGVTARTDVVDLTIQGLFMIGLNSFIKDTEDKRLPVLGEIPVIMRFFRPKAKQRERPDLIMFLEPRIIDNPEQ